MSFHSPQLHSYRLVLTSTHPSRQKRCICGVYIHSHFNVSFQCPPELVDQEMNRLSFLELPFSTWPSRQPLLPCQSLISGFSSGDETHTHRLGDSTWPSQNPRPWGRLNSESSTSESSIDDEFQSLWFELPSNFPVVPVVPVVLDTVTDTGASDADDEFEDDD
jgi:hypothetical protein